MKLSCVSKLLATPFFGGNEDLLVLLLCEVVVDTEEVPLFGHQLAFLFREESAAEFVRALEEALHPSALQERNKAVIVLKVISDEAEHSTIEADMKLRVPVEIVD